eukprot:m.158285 g.158285  ORF g.158285 m.158285 type:complete len:577 (-) comp17016_c0_seq1:20-1750(-)
MERQAGDVVQGLMVVLQVLQLNLQIQVMLLDFGCQIQRVFEVARLPTDLDGGGKVKVEVLVRHDELVQLVHPLELGVAVQEQSGVVLVGQLALVQGLQVVGEVVDALRVEELADHIGGLQLPNGLDVLLNGCVVVGLAVQVFGIRGVNVDEKVAALLAAVLAFGQVDGNVVQLLLEEAVQLALEVFLHELVHLAVAAEDKDRAPLAQHKQDVVKGLRVHNKLVADVVDGDVRGDLAVVDRVRPLALAVYNNEVVAEPGQLDLLAFQTKRCAARFWLVAVQALCAADEERAVDFALHSTAQLTAKVVQLLPPLAGAAEEEGHDACCGRDEEDCLCAVLAEGQARDRRAALEEQLAGLVGEAIVCKVALVQEDVAVCEADGNVVEVLVHADLRDGHGLAAIENLEGPHNLRRAVAVRLVEIPHFDARRDTLLVRPHADEDVAEAQLVEVGQAESVGLEAVVLQVALEEMDHAAGIAKDKLLVPARRCLDVQRLKHDEEGICAHQLLVEEGEPADLLTHGGSAVRVAPVSSNNYSRGNNKTLLLAGPLPLRFARKQAFSKACLEEEDESEQRADLVMAA